MSFNYDYYMEGSGGASSLSTNGVVDIYVPENPGSTTLLATIIGRATTTPVTSSGWTELFSVTNGGVSIAVLYRTFEDHPSQTHTFTLDAVPARGRIEVYKYLDADNLVHSVATATDSGTTSSVATPALTSPAVSKYCKVLYFRVFGKSGWTEREISGGDLWYGNYEDSYGWGASTTSSTNLINDADGDPVTFTATTSGDGISATLALNFANPSTEFSFGETGGFQGGSISYESEDPLRSVGLEASYADDLEKGLQLVKDYSETDSGVYTISYGFDRVVHHSESATLLPDPNA